MSELLNANPVIHEVNKRKTKKFAARRRPLQKDASPSEISTLEREPFDEEEIFGKSSVSA
jgi:hypothetical protein